ncbi:MAG: glycosyltransferase [Bacteroidales bacterium]|nr:glycosyltransferase [Bacteroidales bacterium]
MVLLCIAAFVLLLYLIYPVWIACIIPGDNPERFVKEKINSVSLILLAYNGGIHLPLKIQFLIEELSGFQSYELIIVDDCSTDGTTEILDKVKGNDRVKTILNPTNRGIPYSMNLAVDHAENDIIVFCDQRQLLVRGILKKIIEPFSFSEVGAVSGCISSYDKKGRHSIARWYENLLKSLESKTGNLMGVYGPFYAIRKECYEAIPGDIILDDLYLSLRILRRKKIILFKDCKIIDDDFTALYDYRRARRYLAGLIQILGEKEIIRDLSVRQRTMLIWHKYLRLVIPFFLVMAYIFTGMMSFRSPGYLVVFGFLTVLVAFSVMPGFPGMSTKTGTLVRINLYYFLAWADILVSRYVFRKSSWNNPRIN